MRREADDVARWERSESEFGFAIAWLRMCAVVRGDALPRLHEPIDLLLLTMGDHDARLDFRRPATGE